MEITRRTVLVSFVVIGLAAAAAGAGTMALFSDQESSSGNTVQAGTLDLAVSETVDGKIINVSNAKPGDSGSNSINLTNDGSIDGSLDFGITEIRSLENGAETPSEFYDGPPGELNQSDNLQVKMTYVAPDESEDVLQGGWVNASELTTGVVDYNKSVASGETAQLQVEWRIPEDAGNDIQGDSIEVDVKFELNQQDSQ